MRRSLPLMVTIVLSVAVASAAEPAAIAPSRLLDFLRPGMRVTLRHNGIKGGGTAIGDGVSLRLIGDAEWAGIEANAEERRERVAELSRQIAEAEGGLGERPTVSAKRPPSREDVKAYQETMSAWQARRQDAEARIRPLQNERASLRQRLPENFPTRIGGTGKDWFSIVGDGLVTIYPASRLREITRRGEQATE